MKTFETISEVMVRQNFNSIAELKSAAAVAEEEHVKSTDVEFLDRRQRELYLAADRQYKNSVKKYSFLERCLILNRRLMQLAVERDETRLVHDWENRSEEIEKILENLEPILTRIYEEGTLSENETVSNSNTVTERTDGRRRRRENLRIRRADRENKLMFTSIAELRAQAEESESIFEGKNAKFLRKLIYWRWWSAYKYQKRRNIEREYYFLARCRILIQRLLPKYLVKSDLTESLQIWEDGIGRRLENLEPTLTVIYEEAPEINKQEALSMSTLKTESGNGRKEQDWKLMAKKRNQMDNKHSQFKLIGDYEEHTFEEWVECLGLRFQTREWNTSLDFDSYKIIYDKESREKIGALVELGFAIRYSTFEKRMGRAGMDLIKEYKFIQPKNNVALECPNVIRKESFFVIIRDKDEYEEHEAWVEELERCLEGNYNKYQIIKHIKDNRQEPIGVYMRLPYPKRYDKFFYEMEEFMGAVSYVAKTSTKLSGKVLTNCYNIGFFDRMENKEFY